MLWMSKMVSGRIAMNIVEIRNIKKCFGSVRALDGVSLDIEEGKITAIVGDNGSGKSTLIKIISGVEAPDDGTIFVAGEEYKKLSVKKALEIGINTVYQDLALDNTKNSIENIFLGQELMKGPFVDRREMEKRTRELLMGLNLNIDDLYEAVSRLSGGQRQGIAIARAIMRQGKLLIWDEPTAAMGVAESHRIIEKFKKLKNEGHTQLLVSHNMQQVFSIADRIFVFRAGKCIADVATEQMSIEELNELLIKKEEGALNEWN